MSWVLAFGADPSHIRQLLIQMVTMGSICSTLARFTFSTPNTRYMSRAFDARVLVVVVFRASVTVIHHCRRISSRTSRLGWRVCFYASMNSFCNPDLESHGSRYANAALGECTIATQLPPGMRRRHLRAVITVARLGQQSTHLCRLAQCWVEIEHRGETPTRRPQRKSMIPHGIVAIAARDPAGHPPEKFSRSASMCSLAPLVGLKQWVDK